MLFAHGPHCIGMLDIKLPFFPLGRLTLEVSTKCQHKLNIYTALIVGRVGNPLQMVLLGSLSSGRLVLINAFTCRSLLRQIMFNL